jgi:enoyl-CoA hydratase
MASEDGLNVASVAAMTSLREALAELASDERARAVVLTGSGGRAFCAGADIKYMSTLDRDGATEWGRLGHEVTGLLETMPKATIAALDGLTLGGGMELALACDLRYASSATKLGQPEVNLALMPGWGGTQRLARASSLGFAKELILTGRVIAADEALQRGVVDAVEDPVLDKALEVAAGIAAKSAAAVAAAKHLCNLALQGAYPEILEQEATNFGDLFGTTETAEGLRAFVEKREPRFARPD